MSTSSFTNSPTQSTSERDSLLCKGRSSPAVQSERIRHYSTHAIVQEGEESITIRRPLNYESVAEQSSSTRACLSRYKYYSKLQSHSAALLNLLMPTHVVPPEFYLVIPFKPEGGKQSSIVTIFSIWNTMVGTSLLSIPWAIQQAGFGLSLALIFLMVCLCLYTSYRVVKSVYYIDPIGDVSDFSEVCRYYFGKWGDYLTIIFSCITNLGAAVIYWVLMSNFLYHTGNFIYEHVYLTNQSNIINENNSFADALCPIHFDSKNISSTFSDDSTFQKVWHQTHTVPFFLLIFLVPLINFQSPTFFTKFNALGTVSIVYVVTFVVIKAAGWGINANFVDAKSKSYVAEFHSSFPALTGILALALFIHNCLISIVRTQKNPENNVRDISIAYLCVALTYVIIGAVFYLSFPLPKSCIEDNLLNNFQSTDILSFVARLFLLFQMCTVFPLITFVMRAQVLHTIFGNPYPSLRHVLGFNTLVVAICLLFAVFMPKIGTIIRFSGALCGFSYVFTLPCAVYLFWLKSQNHLTWKAIFIHSIIILIGLSNFIGQFLVQV